MSEHRSFDKILAWIQNYGQGGIEDQKGAENCVICETDEFINPLRAQLHFISKGEFDEEALDRVIGVKRRLKYGSYENWAKLMIFWLNDAKKRA